MNNRHKNQTADAVATTHSTDFKLRLKQPNFWNTPNPEMEEKLLAHWRASETVKHVAEARHTSPTYWLLDGPPYANGDAHLGHLLNKTLKDVNARFQSGMGKKVVWRSGWDCHGLPLELGVEKRVGSNSKDNALLFMQECRKEALTWQAAQSKTMQRLGLLADFDKPWLTMDPVREASALDLLREFWEAGLLVERKSPVHWCPACQSALAASELEKADKTRVEAYFVAELTPSSVAQLKKLLPAASFEKMYVLSWTTTPWTVFANAGFAHPAQGTVSLVELRNGKKVLVASDALPSFVTEYPDLVSTSGSSLEYTMDFEQFASLGLTAVSPMSGRVVPLVSASFASSTEGSGFVHVAPAFGPDDFTLHEKENVELVCHVSSNGRLLSPGGEHGVLPAGMENMPLDQASEASVAWLNTHGHLVHSYTTTVEAQTCWRHKKPVFYMASDQWALDLEKGFEGCPEGLASRATKALEETVFLPDDRAKTPLVHMLATRRYWTLSRDRLWGLPLPFYRHKDTGALHPKTNTLWLQLCERVRTEGVEAWASMETPEGYVKSTQVVDVWFDSGSAWHHAGEEGMTTPNLGVEGRDQTRGWYLSSFLLHAFKSSEPAFRSLMTHSFVVGENGMKLSKSTGGGGAALDPLAVFAKEGADVFRVWVSAQNVGDEARWGKTALKQATQDVKDWRSFLRFMLANMRQAVNTTEAVELMPMEKLALTKATSARDAWSGHMQTGRFNQAMSELNNFRLWASAEWFELNKRRLYCAKDSDLQLLSLQWALQEVFVLFTSMLAVVMPFSAEEAYLAWPKHPNASVFLATVPSWSYSDNNTSLVEALDWRKKVLPTVEKARGLVEKGTPVLLSVASAALPYCVEESLLRDWFGTCFVTVDAMPDAFDSSVRDDSLNVVAGKAALSYTPYRCTRCRTYFSKPLTSENLCTQCVEELQ